MDDILNSQVNSKVQVDILSPQKFKGADQKVVQAEVQEEKQTQSAALKTTQYAPISEEVSEAIGKMLLDLEKYGMAGALKSDLPGKK